MSLQVIHGLRRFVIAEAVCRNLIELTALVPENGKRWLLVAIMATWL